MILISYLCIKYNNMKKETFIKFIQLSIDKGKKEKIIYNNGLDLINFMDEYSKINNILLCSIYDEPSSDMINDFIFDSIYDELDEKKSNYLIYDTNDNVVADCSTIDGLYDFVESERLRLISDGFSYQMKAELTESERLSILQELFNK